MSKRMKEMTIIYKRGLSTLQKGHEYDVIICASEMKPPDLGGLFSLLLNIC